MSLDKTTHYNWDRPNQAAVPPVNLSDELARLGVTLEQIDAVLYALSLLAGGKAPSVHSHSMGDITGLSTALSGKMAFDKTFKLDDLTDVDGADGAANGQVLAKTAAGWVPALPLALLGSHGHTIDQVSGLQTALDGKQNIADRGALAGFRNKIINGDFDVWQRFTTTGTWVAPVSNAYTADRWVASSSGTGGNGSLSLQAFSPGQTAVPGAPDYFLRWQITSAASGQTAGSGYIEQRMEGVKTLAGKKATVTLYVKGSGTLPSINLVQQFGSGGSSLVATVLASNVVLGGSWTKLQYVVDIPSISGKTIGSGNYIALNINVPINATFTLDLAHVSVVEGDAASEADPFAPRHLQQEIALCQRYYEKGSFRIHSAGVAASGSSGGRAFFKVSKRVVPTVTRVDTSLTNSNPTSIQGQGTDGVDFIASALATNTTQAVAGTWTADAEI